MRARLTSRGVARVQDVHVVGVLVVAARAGRHVNQVAPLDAEVLARHAPVAQRLVEEVLVRHAAVVSARVTQPFRVLAESRIVDIDFLGWFTINSHISSITSRQCFH